MRIGNKRIPLNTLHTFERVGHLLNMGRAAAELSVTQSAISHQIRQLETELDIRLFDRSKKQLRLTDAGLRLLDAVSGGLDQIKSGALNLDNQKLDGKFTLAATPTFTTLWLIPNLPDFLERFPKLEVRLKMMQLPIPASLPEADLVIQFGKHPWRRKRVLALTHADYLLVCSPRLLIQIGRTTPESLVDHVLIHDDNGEAWGLWLAQAGFESLKPRRNIYVGNAIDAMELARRGEGIAISDHIICSNWLGSGELVQPFSQRICHYDSYYVVSPHDDQISPAAREFEAWLRKNIR